ncbi:MAG: DUF3413 domain-containing protein [Gammaproteobacteria bacterium]|nr:DUF3413 domain-containing protein [Gammaproteobacteria bacterium]
MGRRALLRRSGWFAAANAALFGLVGLRFLAGYPFPDDVLGLAYLVLAFVGHFALLAALPIGLVVVPLVLLVPRPWLVTAVAVALEALVLTLLVVDGNVFAEQRYHLTPLVAMLFETATWVFVVLIAVFALLFQALLAGYVNRWVAGAPARGGYWLAALLGSAWIASQAIHIGADAVGLTSVTQLTRYLPAYFPIHAKRTLARWGLVDAATVERRRLIERAGAAAEGQLAYPLQPLRCDAGNPALNLLVVLIDALRPDVAGAPLMPRLAALQVESAVFANHWSGGNSSKAGIFSAFYGLPATYETAFYGVQRPPVLLDVMRERGYRFGLVAAPGVSAPTDIGRTLFAGFAGLPGERRDLDAPARNRAVTDGWLDWLAGREPGRPFFGFLYSDPPMAEMPIGSGPELPLDERYGQAPPRVREAWERYRRGARFSDAELGRVLDGLDAAGLRESTIVVVLSDHGYEFDDLGRGYLGHASNFGAPQLRATLVVRWPGRAPAVYRHRSAHVDLPVTLLADAFGCTNDPADYATGRNLFAGTDWPWIIAGSYNAHAIVTPERIVVTHPGGFVEVLDADYRPADGGLDAATVSAAMAAMRRFYR